MLIAASEFFIESVQAGFTLATPGAYPSLVSSGYTLLSMVAVV